MSDLAKDFIDKLLVLDADRRMTAEEGLKHPWITSCASSSSLKNLSRSVSQNWIKSSSRVNSAKSNSSQKSNKSGRSGRSSVSLRRSNNTTVPLDANLISALSNAPAQESKQSGNKSSGLRESNVKLTKQLVEKLHSVINEDDREFLQSTSTENQSTPEPSHTECEDSGQQVRTSNSQAVVLYREVQNSHDCRKVNSLVLDYVSQEAEEEKSRGIPVPGVRERSHVVMRDNFLEEQQYIQGIQQDESHLATSPSRLHPLSPSPRKNKVYCTYDTV